MVMMREAKREARQCMNDNVYSAVAGILVFSISIQSLNLKKRGGQGRNMKETTRNSRAATLEPRTKPKPEPAGTMAGTEHAQQRSV